MPVGQNNKEKNENENFAKMLQISKFQLAFLLIKREKEEITFLIYKVIVSRPYKQELFKKWLFKFEFCQMTITPYQLVLDSLPKLRLRGLLQYPKNICYHNDCKECRIGHLYGRFLFGLGATGKNPLRVW